MKKSPFKGLLRLIVKIALLAEFAVLLERKLLFHFLLVALGVVRDTATNRALQFGHVFLNLAHSNKKLSLTDTRFTLREFCFPVNTFDKNLSR